MLFHYFFTKIINYHLGLFPTNCRHLFLSIYPYRMIFCSLANNDLDINDVIQTLKHSYQFLRQQAVSLQSLASNVKINAMIFNLNSALT